jgi:hypothetical protein
MWPGLPRHGPRKSHPRESWSVLLRVRGAAASESEPEASEPPLAGWSAARDPEPGSGKSEVREHSPPHWRCHERTRAAPDRPGPAMYGRCEIGHDFPSGCRAQAFGRPGDRDRNLIRKPETRISSDSRRLRGPGPKLTPNGQWWRRPQAISVRCHCPTLGSTKVRRGASASLKSESEQRSAALGRGCAP